MDCLSKEGTMRIEKIKEAVGTLSKATLEVYFKNWRFAPYVKRVRRDRYWHYEYLYCQDFFNHLYTYLTNKRQIKGAENLKKNFEKEGLKLEYLED
jgi:hypothetical protein